MKRFYISILIQLLMLALAITSEAQLFPVQVNTQLTPPYSPYLTDYTSAGSQRLTLQFRLNDVNLSDYNVKLRITIEGVGITIRTKQTFIPQPITLQGGGIPIILYGEDISEYFNPNNLDFAGFTRREYESAGKIPEGVYRFSVEVLDYNRNIVVSNKGTTVAWMILNDPPLLNLPRNDTKVRILDPTNIAFTWTPRHTGSPNSAFSTEYNFKLVEIWPVNRNPYDAFLSQPALYEVTTTQSQIIYGLAEPALIPGRKYAWQVQATDTDGRDLFKNQGRSEVYVFQFGDELGVPENFRKETANAATMSVRWEPSTIGEMPDQYRVRYKPVSSDKWLETISKQSWTTLTHLQPNTAYDVQVRGERQRRFGEYTVSQRMNTAEEKPAGNYSCGTTVNLQRSDTTGFLLELAPGDVFSCADFKVVVAQAKKIPNGFAGTGLMQINMLNGASVEVNFSGSINREYKLTAGSVESTYAKGSAMGRVIEEMDKIGEEKKEEPKPKTDSTDVPRPIDIIYAGVIDSVYVNEDGKIEVIDEDGTITTHEPKKNPTTKEVQETVIADSGGNTYAVGKDGKVTKTSGAPASGSGNTTTVQNPIKEKIIVLILEQFEEEINAWLRINGKGGEEDEDVLLAASLPECFPQNANILDHINESTIPYFKKHPAELRERIESTQTNKQLLDKIAKPFINVDAVSWDKVPEDDKEALNNLACSATVEADIASLQTELTNKIGSANTGGDCLYQAWSRGKELYGEYEFQIVVYAGFIRFVICSTEKDNCGQSGGLGAYSCGLSNGLLQELDWVFLLEGDGITKEDIVELILCVKASIPIGGRREDNPEFNDILFKCITGVSTGDMGNAIKDFIVENWDEVYYQGQATAFVLTLISPFKAKIIAKLGTLPKYTSKIAKLESLAKAKNADELVDIAKGLAKGADVPSSLVTKLSQQGSGRLKAWLSSKTLNYVDNAGAKFLNSAAETKIFNDLDAAIGNQKVLNTIEDANGRLLVQCEGSNRNTVYGLVKKNNGEYTLYKFEPAYKPTANPSIDVPLSKNLLAPDFSNSRYLYPVTGNKKNVVKIKMKGDRTPDFKEANKAAGFGDSGIPPSLMSNGEEIKYTWHHLDDFDPITGECTMQLVESSAHREVGMTHTGSVGQYKAFNGFGY